MSLKEIADLAGTSISTVSKVLNDSASGCASAQLKDKIWKAAHETGYVPNKNARNLKKGITDEKRPKRVVVVMARVGSLELDFFFRELYRQLEISLFGQGFILAAAVSASDISDSDLSGCDGMIVMGRCSEKLLKKLKEYTQNIVGIWRNPMDFEVDEIVCDGREAAKKAVHYLYELGHRNIGYIGDCSYESRYVGYSEAMISLGLAIDYEHIIPTDQSMEEGKRAALRLLESRSISAVLCANDMTAIGVLSVLETLKKKERQRLSVISIDDIEQAQETKPLLTTVHIPRSDMAHMAVKILSDRMDRGHSRPVRVEFPCPIVIRESCFKIQPSSTEP